MIEVEKKFILNKEEENKLIEGAEFLGQKEFTDVYYDTQDFSLTTKDLWLRKRDNRFELKIPMNASIEERVSDQYKELEANEEILKYFDKDPHTSIEALLEEKHFKPFCTITTKRRKYQKENFTIDLDIVDFGYTLAEIEYMIEDASTMQEAANAIIAFAQKHGVGFDNSIPIRGKVVEYLRRNNPQHFQALIDAKVIK